MTGELPEHVVPRRAGAAAATLAGFVPVAGVDRLATKYELLGPVVARLAFAAEGSLRVWVSGRVEARVLVECQRCLEKFPADIAADVDVGFGAELEDDDREVLDGIDDELGLAGFIEDELLLGAPMVHRHPAGKCGTAHASAGEGLPGNNSPAATRRPFQELSSLLAARDSKPKTGD